jgi:hypothetical protein
MRWENDLVRDIRTSSSFDDNDFGTAGLSAYWRQGGPNGYPPEFSACNRQSLLQAFEKVKGKCNAIVEIGVCRNGEESSSYVFINNKRDETFYVGIDLEDKSFLDNKDKRVFTFKNSSSNIKENIEKLKELGIEKIDFLFIDGFHSINQLLIDWEYTEILSEDGVVGFHDVNHHPGPQLFVGALDPWTWQVTKECPDDWGIAFAKRIA